MQMNSRWYHHFIQIVFRPLRLNRKWKNHGFNGKRCFMHLRSTSLIEHRWRGNPRGLSLILPNGNGTRLWTCANDMHTLHKKYILTVITVQQFIAERAKTSKKNNKRERKPWEESQWNSAIIGHPNIKLWLKKDVLIALG